MDGKRRGRAGLLNNGKLRWSLYRSRATAANKLPPSSTTVLHLPYPAATHHDQGGYMKMLNQPAEHIRPPHQSYNKITVNHHQDHQLTPQLQIPTHTRPRSVSTPDITNNTAVVDSYSAAKMDTLYGGAAVDEAVDLKAANYISSVREKFRLDYLN